MINGTVEGYKLPRRKHKQKTLTEFGFPPYQTKLKLPRNQDELWRNENKVQSFRLLPKGTFEILVELTKGQKRFSHLAHVKVGSKPINRHTLTSRLKMLEKEKLVIRTVKNGRPPNVLYSLTERGYLLLELI